MAPALRFSEDVSTTGRRGVDGTSAVASELTYGPVADHSGLSSAESPEVPFDVNAKPIHSATLC
jgi:hypothetical protein